MYTSGRKNKRIYSAIKFYSASAGFFLVFGAVYEVFSHSVYTPYMYLAFLVPLLLGVVPHIVLLAMHKTLPSEYISGLYGGGVHMLTLWSVMSGVAEIYGTTNSKLVLYPIGGGIMFLFALALYVLHCKKDA